MAVSLVALTTWHGIVPGANDFFVSTKGNDSNTGAHGDPWRTIEASQAKIVAGDTLWIKAGKYAERVTLTKDGASGSPIQILGYREHPGDASDVASTFDHTSTLEPTVLPLIDSGDRTTGNCFTFSGRDYLVLKNFMVTGAAAGFYGYSADNNVIENIVSADIGDQFAGYSGHGFDIAGTSSNNTITNCVVVNSCAQGFTLSGHYNAVEGFRVFCDDTTSGDDRSNTDYYFVILDVSSGVASTYNTVNNCYIERVGNLPHGGHGFLCKWNAEYNTFTNCHAENITGFACSYRGVKFNLFEDCTSVGGVSTILCREGASENTFRRIVNLDGAGAYSSQRGHVCLGLDTTEDGGQQWLSSDNVIEDCTFAGGNSAIYFGHQSGAFADSGAYDNTIDNCTFDGMTYMFSVWAGPNGTNSGLGGDNVVTNCTFTDISIYAEYFNSLDITDIGTTHTTAAGNIATGTTGDLDAPPWP